MRNRCLTIFFILSHLITNASTPETNSLLTELKKQLIDIEIYDRVKESSISNLKKEKQSLKTSNLLAQFNVCNKLYEEYKVYKFDSAFVYANKMIELGKLLNSRPKESYSRVKLGFIYLTSGMFKETFDCIAKVNTQYLSDTSKSEYYLLIGRAYYDLAGYNNNKFISPAYISTSNNYMDSAIYFNRNDPVLNAYLLGTKQFQELNYGAALSQFKYVLNSKISVHFEAMAACQLGYIQLYRNNKEQGVNLLIRAAIADIKSSTKETVALWSLAELLFKDGNITDAYNFIQYAKADADFYGARQRKMQIGAILPLIASKAINNVEHQKNRLLFLFFGITSLTIIIVLFLITLFKQLKKVKLKEKIIEEKNVQFKIVNQKLYEAAKINEEYIGQFFKEISSYILKLENLKMSIHTKLALNKYEDIQVAINNIDIKKERLNLYDSFDHVFLKIFPNFILVFNSLFLPINQIKPHDNELLNTELRIFALIRMGIKDTDTIAKILEYSANTIYIYKMRIKAKSIDPETFESTIANIKENGLLD